MKASIFHRLNIHVHVYVDASKYYVLSVAFKNNGWIWVKESYLHIPQPEIRTIVWAAGNNVSAIWAPGNVGHPIGMVLKSLLNSQLIRWLKYKPTCLQYCACFLVTSYNLESDYSQKCFKQIMASEISLIFFLDVNLKVVFAWEYQTDKIKITVDFNDLQNQSPR